jgi:hypothetical protein
LIFFFISQINFGFLVITIPIFGVYPLSVPIYVDH